jgi:type IV pilus assembly protein PilA
MLIKMRESKGFTLVELMIVVAIIGILAAVAVPFYQRYVQKARLTSLVFPTMHSVETNIGAYYSGVNQFPDATQYANYTADASSIYCKLKNTSGGSLNILTFMVHSGGATSALYQLHGLTISATAKTDASKITGWNLSGTLAAQLGLK